MNYEIWVAYCDSDDCIRVEDCSTMEQAKAAVIEYQQDGNTAWIQDKKGYITIII